jgi:hypothetical protein
MTVEEAFSMTGKDAIMAALPFWIFVVGVVFGIVMKIVVAFIKRM